MKLTDNAIDIFKDVEPGLIAIGKSFNLHDPEGEAKSWYPKYLSILHRFDSGHFYKQYLNNSTKQLVPDAPTQEIECLFLKSLGRYIKVAYRNDLSAEYNKERRKSEISTNAAQQGCPDAEYTTILSSYDTAEIISLKDLIHIISIDLNRAIRNASIAREELNRCFIQALLEYYNSLYEMFGDFSIIRDYFAIDSKDFFIYDIREGRTEGVRANLVKLIEDLNIISVSLMGNKFLSKPDGYIVLNKKISRYFNEYLGGMPNRLKELKTKQTNTFPGLENRANNEITL